jgi:hypothetical protein
MRIGLTYGPARRYAAVLIAILRGGIMDSQRPGDQQQTAEAALAKSGLNVEKLSPEQHQQILEQISQRLPQPTATPSGFETDFTIDFGCIACEAGMNVVAGAAIGVLVVAGVAVGPETAGVAMIASFFGVDVLSVVTVINGALGAGGAASVEGVIAALCEKLGAC